MGQSRGALAILTLFLGSALFLACGQSPEGVKGGMDGGTPVDTLTPIRSESPSPIFTPREPSPSMAPATSPSPGDETGDSSPDGASTPTWMGIGTPTMPPTPPTTPSQVPVTVVYEAEFEHGAFGGLDIADMPAEIWIGGDESVNKTTLRWLHDGPMAGAEYAVDAQIDGQKLILRGPGEGGPTGGRLMIETQAWFTYEIEGLGQNITVDTMIAEWGGRIQSPGGDIRVLGSYGDVGIDADGGSIYVQNSLHEGHEIQINMGVGSVEIEIPRDTLAAWVHATTGNGQVIFEDLICVGGYVEGGSSAQCHIGFDAFDPAIRVLSGQGDIIIAGR